MLEVAARQGLPAPQPGGRNTPRWSKTSEPEAATAMASTPDPTNRGIRPKGVTPALSPGTEGVEVGPAVGMGMGLMVRFAEHPAALGGLAAFGVTGTREGVDLAWRKWDSR